MIAPEFFLFDLPPKAALAWWLMRPYARLSEEGKTEAWLLWQEYERRNPPPPPSKEQQAEIARLQKLDAPQRIARLREKLTPYIQDLAVRQFFRLEYYEDGARVVHLKAHALYAFIETGRRYDLTHTEIEAAFRAEWSACMDQAVAIGAKLRIIALSHLKASGTPQGIFAAFLNERRKWPQDWPWLTDDELEEIAAGFNKPVMRKAS